MPSGPSFPVDPGAGGQHFDAVVRAQEDAIRHDPIESLHAFDSSGDLLLSKTGGPREVEISLLELARLRDGVLTHNHPAGTSFSLDDVQVAILGNLAEIRVVTAEWRFILVRPSAGSDSETFHRLVRPAYQHQRDEVLREFLLAINDHRMTEDEANTEYTHEVWSRVARAVGLEYRREP